MKVLCTDDTYLKQLIRKGTWYTAGPCGDNSYLVMTDRGSISKLDKTCFKTIGQIRQEKLNELIWE